MTPPWAGGGGTASARPATVPTPATRDQQEHERREEDDDEDEHDDDDEYPGHRRFFCLGMMALSPLLYFPRRWQEGMMMIMTMIITKMMLNKH